MRFARLALAPPALLLATSLASCGAHGGNVFDPRDAASNARGDAAPSCEGAPRSAEPLVVGLDSEVSADLETAMKQGVVVVAYDCKSLRVLPSCTAAAGGYGFTGVERKEQMIQIKNQGELATKLPLVSERFARVVQGGGSIDLALVLVGQSSTSVGEVARESLVGSCAGATHFVRRASLGAFSMVASSGHTFVAVAELFDASVSYSSASSHQATNHGGSLEGCRMADPGTPRPPADCSAPIRVELIPLQGVRRAQAQGRPPSGGW